MTIDSGIIKEDDDKKSQKKILDKPSKKIKKKEEEIDIQEKAEDNLSELKQMLDKGVLDESTEDLVEDIVNIESISQKEIEEIFDKIDEIESTRDIDELLPIEFRITKDDYKKSLNNDNYRAETIQKINSALSIIVPRITKKSGVGMNIFGSFLLVLDKKLVKIQEHSIDIKNSLKKVDKKAFLEKEKKSSFFQKIIEFINEVYNS